MSRLPVLISFFILIVACKPDGAKHSSSTSASPTAQVKNTLNDQIDLRTIDVADLKGKELSKWTFLTRGYFAKAVEIKSGEVKVDEVKGQWMKLLDDQRYQFGLDDQITQYGIWSYDNDKSLIHFENQSPVGQNSEWKVAAGNDNVVFVGSPRYNNNGTQIKWERVMQ